MSSPPKEDDREDIPFSLLRRPKKKTENKNVIEDFNSKISILNSEDVDKVVDQLRGTVEEKRKTKNKCH